MNEATITNINANSGSVEISYDSSHKLEAWLENDAHP